MSPIATLLQTAQHTLTTVPLPITALASIFLIPLLIYLTTTISYYISLSRLNDNSHGQPSPTSNKNTPQPSQQQQTPTLPPLLPYTLPFLGLAPSFLSTTPGKFWRFILHTLSSHPRLTILSVYMGGRKLHVLYSPRAVTSLFKARNVSRNRFNRDVIVKGMCLNERDAVMIYGKEGKADEGMGDEFEHRQTELYNKYLLGAGAVNGLTARFMETLMGKLRSYCDEVGVPMASAAVGKGAGKEEGEWHTLPLVAFLKQHMFTASTIALYGTSIFDFIPQLAQYYWSFDTGLLSRFYGLPRWLYPGSYAGVAEFHQGMTRWVEAGNAHYDNEPPVDGVEWEEHFGAAIVRARRRLYMELGMSTAGMASFDMGFMFGLSSNAIPATTWLLCHLLSPSNEGLLRKVQQEVDSAKRPGGKFDMSILLGLPYLNSCFNETLRMYVDVLVTRELRDDMVIEGHWLPKGDVVMAPIFIGHHDPNEWNRLPHPDAQRAEDSVPPENVWFGERFLKIDEKTGKAALSTRDMAGKYFPWGGGPQICPGRVFAKQEVLGAVAVFLGMFEISFDEYLGGKDGEMGVGRDEGRSFPVVKKQYSGNGVVAIQGDVRVKVRRREWWKVTIL